MLKYSNIFRYMKDLKHYQDIVANSKDNEFVFAKRDDVQLIAYNNSIDTRWLWNGYECKISWYDAKRKKQLKRTALITSEYQRFMRNKYSGIKVCENLTFLKAIITNKKPCGEKIKNFRTLIYYKAKITLVNGKSKKFTIAFTETTLKNNIDKVPITAFCDPTSYIKFISQEWQVIKDGVKVVKYIKGFVKNFKRKYPSIILKKKITNNKNKTKTFYFSSQRVNVEKMINLTDVRNILSNVTDRDEYIKFIVSGWDCYNIDVTFLGWSYTKSKAITIHLEKNKCVHDCNWYNGKGVKLCDKNVSKNDFQKYWKYKIELKHRKLFKKYCLKFDRYYPHNKHGKFTFYHGKYLHKMKVNHMKDSKINIATLVDKSHKNLKNYFIDHISNKSDYHFKYDKIIDYVSGYNSSCIEKIKFLDIYGKEHKYISLSYARSKISPLNYVTLANQSKKNILSYLKLNPYCPYKKNSSFNWLIQVRSKKNTTYFYVCEIYAGVNHISNFFGVTSDLNSRMKKYDNEFKKYFFRRKEISIIKSKNKFIISAIETACKEFARITNAPNIGIEGLRTETLYKTTTAQLKKICEIDTIDEDLAIEQTINILGGTQKQIFVAKKRHVKNKSELKECLIKDILNMLLTN